jgi:hypothetical protein
VVKVGGGILQNSSRNSCTRTRHMVKVNPYNHIHKQTLTPSPNKHQQVPPSSQPLSWNSNSTWDPFPAISHTIPRGPIISFPTQSHEDQPSVREQLNHFPHNPMRTNHQSESNWNVHIDLLYPFPHRTTISQRAIETCLTHRFSIPEEIAIETCPTHRFAIPEETT